jgi:hypothetical protein
MTRFSIEISRNEPRTVGVGSQLLFNGIKEKVGALGSFAIAGTTSVPINDDVRQEPVVANAASNMH